MALTLAMVAAMITDGVLYSGLLGRIGNVDVHMASKMTGGFAVALPMAAFIAHRLRQAPGQVREGVFDRGAFDIVDMRRQISSMRDQLSRREAEFAHLKDIFGRYVAPDVVDEILEDASQVELGGEVREVTILFSDIRGYSTLSEQLSPTQVIGLLNQYFTAMSKHLDRERGTIIEFEGDAILAVFGAPLAQPDHADRALRTARAMLTEMEALNARWDDDGTSEHWKSLGMPDFRIRIGVHSGEVVVGNVGSETRTKYAVIGDTVNIAARVEQLNKRLQTWMLLTDGTVSRLSTGETGLVALGEHTVRGRKEGVVVYTLPEMGPQSAVAGAGSTTPAQGPE